MIRIRVAVSPGERRIAVCDGEKLLDYAIWRPGAPDGYGDVLAGRVIARVPAMAGTFIALPDDEGFLPDSEAEVLTQGALVRVRVARSAQGGKGPRLTLEGKGTVPQGTPPGLIERGPSPLHRLAALHPDAAIDIDDAGVLAGLRAVFGHRLNFAARSFDAALEAEIEALGASWADLPGGLRAGFFPTPALTAIDLDGASASARRGEKAKLQFAANLGALPELVRQIRLRNLSGAILLDFAGVAAKRRQALAPGLAERLAADPLRPRLLGFTQLGLAEILRARTSPPLHELLAGAHAAGLAGLRRLARDLRAGGGGRRGRLRAAPEVITALQADAVALEEFAHASAQPAVLQSDPSLPTPTCHTEIM